MPDLIEFNVGGQNFTSTYETIGSDKKCVLYTWYIERKGSAHLTKDRKGRFFIDRDPGSFGIVLNYLRLQNAKQLWEVCLPKDPDRLALLTQEAEHFRLPKLRDQAIALLHKCTTNAADNTEALGYVSEVSWSSAANGSGRNGKSNGHFDEAEEEEKNGR